MNKKSVAPARPQPKEVAVPLADVVVQLVMNGEPSTSVPGATVARVIDAAWGLWGLDFADLLDAERSESRARDFAGLADSLIGTPDTPDCVSDSLAVLRDGFKELAMRIRVLNLAPSTYNVVAE